MVTGSAIQYFNEGVAFFNEGLYDTALKKYNKAISINPIFSEAYNNRGYIYFLIQKYELALQDYNQAIETNPLNPHAFCNRAQVYSKLELFDKALADYTKTIELAPKMAAGFTGRGATLLHFEQFNEAMADFNISIQLDPDFAVAYYYSGICLIKQNKLLYSILFLEKAAQKGLPQGKKVIVDIRGRLFFEASSDSLIQAALEVSTCNSMNEVKELVKKYPYISHENFRKYYSEMLTYIKSSLGTRQGSADCDQSENWIMQLDQ